MYKKTVTYTDFDGVERTEDFWFNFTKAEITEMQLMTDGGLDKYLKRIIKSKDNKAILTAFKELVLKAYGVKSDDGRRFIKNDKIRAEFAQTEAYSDIFIELATDEDAASAFINGVTPNVEAPKNQVAPAK